MKNMMSSITYFDDVWNLLNKKYEHRGNTVHSLVEQLHKIPAVPDPAAVDIVEPKSTPFGAVTANTKTNTNTKKWKI